MAALAYYVSGHGYGHATRTCAIVDSLTRRAPQTTVHVVTDAPVSIFRDVADRISLHPRPIDVGLVQRDAVEPDLVATGARLREYLGSLDRRADDEARFLREVRAGVAVVDVAPLGFLAAGRAGIPALGVANFAWDWIYEPYRAADPAFPAAIERFREIYGRAALLLRLPFAPGMDAFPRREDAPLVVRLARRPAAETRAALGLAGDPRPIVLVSFGGFGLPDLEVEALAAMDDVRFVAFGPPDRPGPANVTFVQGDAHHHPDLVAAARVVVSKPGYGAVAEAIAHGTAFLYAPRPDFPEYPYLVRGLEAHVASAPIPLADLRAGHWAERLRPLLAAPRGTPPARTDGADAVAARLLAHLGV